MFTCEFCTSTFSRESSLFYHQKHTIKCLDIQGRAHPPKPSCRYCGESYAKPSALSVHEEKCPKKPTPTEEKLMEELSRTREDLSQAREEVSRLCHQILDYRLLVTSLEERLKSSELQLQSSQSQLERRIEDITQIASKRSKITHNTIYNQSNVSHNTNNHLDLSNTEHIHSKLAEHLDPQTIAQGQVGIARLLVKNILTTDEGELLYVCTDQDRHIFRYLNHEGKEVKDIRAGHLKDALDRSGIRQLVVEKGEKMWTKEDGSVEMDDLMMYHPRVLEIGTMNDEQNDHRFRNELARLTTKS